jgi:uncharacterized surface protein with fasciclin (FAS1) repeats
MRKILVASLSVLAVVLGGSASAGAQSDPPGTIVEIAQATPELSTLVSAVTAAGLVETLSGPGPFTVFAPTNDAFATLPAGTLDTLLADPTGDLTKILQLHVMSGAVDSAAAIEAAGGTVETLGGPVSVELDGDNLVVGGATVVTADIEASNGIVHVIDAVITEPASGAPSSVEAGNSGLAASNSPNGLLLALVAGVALAGLGGSAFVLQRAGRRD